VKLLQVSEPASLELTEAVRWYEERRSGWGAKLFDAVSQTFEVIEQFQESGARRRATARQLPVRGFPFLVVYRIRPDDVYVVAVAHAKRRPGYWISRS
jgi:hypothetical protein